MRPPPPHSRAEPAVAGWMKGRGMKWDPSAIDLFAPQPGGGGTRVVALQDLDAGYIVASIPHSACLTLRTATASDLAEELRRQLGDESDWIPPLTLAVMFERAMGEDSEWGAYLSAIPLAEPVVAMWGGEERACLEATDIRQAMRDEAMQAAREWSRYVFPIVASHCTHVSCTSPPSA
mmetsp:Transcript_64813/g.204659  ORF Transcript_64813/g.204659 Transcript_64813/m.204659 type:complete len:178 (+) Transcript_64813:354-887(+)